MGKASLLVLLSEHAIVAVASEHKDGFTIALDWIERKDEKINSAGWATLSSIISKKPNEELDIKLIKGLIDRVVKDIHNSKDRTRYTMNGFVIAVGSYIPELTQKALKAADTIGKVKVYMGETSCKVPLATDYINKIIDMGRVGKKRK